MRGPRLVWRVGPITIDSEENSVPAGAEIGLTLRAPFTQGGGPLEGRT